MAQGKKGADICANFLREQNERLASRLERYMKYSLPEAFGPPLLFLLAGAALSWVLSGFRHTRGGDLA